MYQPIDDQRYISHNIGENIAGYRKLYGLTQTELAEEIKYSDKSVSKWERGLGTPDIFVLVRLAAIFGVKVDDLLVQSEVQPPRRHTVKAKNMIIICLECIALITIVALIAFTTIRLINPAIKHAWYAFVVAVPVCCVVCTVLTAVWKKRLGLLISVSLFVWSIGVFIFLMLLKNPSSFLLFTVCGAIQVLLALWFVHLRLLDSIRKIKSR
ncbi:MAG: helix-turn-helix domain-containing protein [Oscillospiraceae bacterium]|nr:helix-turn-helix domain-containing protein [Oscillospiraceae bacterium]